MKSEVEIGGPDLKWVVFSMKKPDFDIIAHSNSNTKRFIDVIVVLYTEHDPN